MEKVLLLQDKLASVFEKIVEYIPSEYGPEDNGGDNIYPVCDAINAANLEGDVFCGASKVVAVINGCDSVLKVPYNGCWSYVEEEVDEKTGEVIVEEEEYFSPFEYADASTSDTDYCLSEYEVYQDAKKYGMERFFPNTCIYGTCKSGVVLQQERVKNFYSAQHKPSNDSRKIVENTEPFSDFCDRNWVALAIDVYGKDAVSELIYFATVIRPEIADDLHNGNLGIRENGEPVILDFSGYRE